MDKKEKKRTNAQNRAMHKYFSLLSDELNEKGLDMRRVLSEVVDIWWTPRMVKEYLFKTMMNIKLKKKSTTELNTKEVDIVFENLQHHLAEKYGIELYFPSIEQKLREDEDKQRLRQRKPKNILRRLRKM